jgi:hypothetical protein
VNDELIAIDIIAFHTPGEMFLSRFGIIRSSYKTTFLRPHFHLGTEADLSTEAERMGDGFRAQRAIRMCVNYFAPSEIYFYHVPCTCYSCVNLAV